MENELILFETADKEIKLTVPIKNNTVWLNRKQLAELFGRDVKTIGKHINNALKEELDNSVVANFATTASDYGQFGDEFVNNVNLISNRNWPNSLSEGYFLSEGQEGGVEKDYNNRDLEG